MALQVLNELNSVFMAGSFMRYFPDLAETLPGAVQLCQCVSHHFSAAASAMHHKGVHSGIFGSKYLKLQMFEVATCEICFTCFFAREALAKKNMWNRSMLGLTGLVWGIFEWKHVLFWKWWSGSCRCSPIRREITLGIYCNIFEVRLVGPSPWLQLCWMWTVSMWL